MTITPLAEAPYERAIDQLVERSDDPPTAATEQCERPWGSWRVLESGPGYKVKRLDVHPGHRLSYQMHAHRAETWVVVFGIATCVIDDVTHQVGPGESITVAQGSRHRIINAHGEMLTIVEVQRGGYTGEDDIERVDDDYGRVRSS